MKFVLPKGFVIDYNSQDLIILEDIGFGHKFALTDIREESNILKYGLSIGKASQLIRKGALGHLHINRYTGCFGITSP